MPHLLRFDVLHGYAPQAPGVLVPVRIAVANRSVKPIAELDTGAAFCVFQRELGEGLGLTIEAGFNQRFATAAGSFRAFGHAVTLEVLGMTFDSMVFFAEPARFPRNVLGRQGWLDRVRLALVHHDSQLYLSPYSR